jgi:mannose-6-phosphate isomerase-like protein (cupin superfamily)
LTLKLPSYHEILKEEIQILRWPHPRPLPEAEVLSFFNARGLSPSCWSNGPGDHYEVHAHPYRKILFCMEGSITFSFSDLDHRVELRHGDRLIIPADMRHGATVGPDGVTCSEAGEK